MDNASQTQVFRHQLPRRVVEGYPGETISLDCQHIEQIRQIAASSFPAIWPEKDFAYFLAHEHRLCVGLVTFEGDQARLRAYFLGLLVQGDLDIICVATRMEDRRLGIAERLLRKVCSRGDVRRAFLEVEVENEPAFQLYKKLGFELLGRRPAYYGPGRDGFLMRWER